MTGQPRGSTGPAGGSASTGLSAQRGREQPDGQPPVGRKGRGGRGPFDPRVWRSPIRGPWLTSVFGLILLIGIPVELVTGLLSYAAYNPRLSGFNDPNPAHAAFGFYLFSWVTAPSWFFRLIQGVHIMLGLALVPVVLAKLWSVLPELFSWPPLRSVAHLLERLSLLMLVGGVIFEMSTGVLEIEYSGIDHIGFYTGHFYGAWIFIAGFAVHVALRMGRMVRALRSRSFTGELRTNLAATEPEPPDADGLVALSPDPPTISRRGVLALIGGTSLIVFLLTAGETIGGFMRRLAILSTHYRTTEGPNGFPVNNTATQKAIDTAKTGASWRLELIGARRVLLSRDDLLSMPQITVVLPIACTDGWSTVQRWSGVPLIDLALRAGTDVAAVAGVHSMDGEAVALSWAQVKASQSLLALKVNGADLSLDHGFPARIMVPAAPGDHQIKWVTTISFGSVGDN
jgi:DMSO/TMAO reductase YedYZ molybdopterin-dependent catalytic subunit